MNAQYIKSINGVRRCALCPHLCELNKGQRGRCGVRGAEKLPCYGELTGVAVDPVEKKPLYHFYPGESILSIGFLGCSMRCPYCQNWTIAQDLTTETRPYTPKEIVEAAKEIRRNIGIAYTYSEPTVHIEYLLECADLVRKAKRKNVLVSNGMLNDKPATDLLLLFDAINLDLKSFRKEDYHALGGSLKTALRFMERAFEAGVHLEVTTLIVPEIGGEAVDWPIQIGEISRFLADLSPEIPLHLSAYHPAYRYSLPATPADLLFTLKKKAEERLLYVYTGNIVCDNTTFCNGCGAALIKRRNGCEAEIVAVRKQKCVACGESAPFIR